MLFRSYDSASVRAYGSASVRAYGSASVEAYGSASVVAYGSARVEAYDSASVMAYDSASVEASGSASVVSMYGEPAVTVRNRAVWIDRRHDTPVIHAVAAELVLRPGSLEQSAPRGREGE